VDVDTAAGSTAGAVAIDALGFVLAVAVSAVAVVVDVPAGAVVVPAGAAPGAPHATRVVNISIPAAARPRSSIVFMPEGRPSAGHLQAER
jgi:hypothetical protein